MAALVSKDSEGIYTDLTSPEKDVYSTLGQTSLNSPGTQHTGIVSAVMGPTIGIMLVCSIWKCVIGHHFTRGLREGFCGQGVPCSLLNSDTPGHSGQSSYPYRRVAVCLGLLCALLLAATVVLCVLYTSLSDNYSMLEGDLEELRSNYSTMYTEKVQLQSTLCKPCLQGWAQFSSKCYYFSNETKSWTDSRSDCEEWGADLMIIESEKEQRFINNKRQYYTWIGLSYSAAKGNWLWVDGTPLQEGSWGKGKSGVKNDLACAVIAPNANVWEAFVCSNKHNFICETNALPP
ncbi:CD209 antigen-like protein E isoform X1 [Anguilla anguilla]|uniref:CD209 antigen-like protein E isoform X1 n=1 Tax=Anguilla anguilla TaxID=7936 RepID=UPI0015B16747|nr:CD209 antigen-like protein E isoform X1 [Anguilla anguilla]